MTKLAFSILGVLLATGAVASAQPGGNMLPGDPESPPTTPPVTPVVVTPPPATPVVVQPAAVAPSADTVDDVHPSEFAIGIGLGYILPTSLETPNVTSVRFRLLSGVQIEPRLVLAVTSQSQSAGGTDVTNSTTELGVGALVRFPVVRHHHFDFEVIGALDVDHVSNDPEGDDNNSSTTRFTLGWGLAVDYWISRHWAFSMTATNPLVSIQSQSMDATPDDQTSTTKSFGLIFSPTVAMMLHVYY